MRLIDIMSADLVIADLASTTRDDVLQEMVERISVVRPEVEASRAQRVLVERERLGSTGVGDGLAIPHARLPALSTAVACFARSRGGVDFGALDGKPTDLFLALLAPAGHAGLHLKALARAARLFKDAAFRGTLRDAPDAATLWVALQAQDEALSLSP